MSCVCKYLEVAHLPFKDIKLSVLIILARIYCTLEIVTDLFILGDFTSGGEGGFRWEGHIRSVLCSVGFHFVSPDLAAYLHLSSRVFWPKLRVCQLHFVQHTRDLHNHLFFLEEPFGLRQWGQGGPLGPCPHMPTEGGH